MQVPCLTADAVTQAGIPARVTKFFFVFMIIVYALKNKVNEEVYVGITSSLDRRLNEHNTGKNRYTKAFMPWFVFYTEKLPDFASARKREKYLKSSSGKRFLKKFIVENPEV